MTDQAPREGERRQNMIDWYGRLRELVSSQKKDPRVFFEHPSTAEAHLQKQLLALHRAIEEIPYR